MGYKENPKTKDSGIMCGIPQKGECPIKCADCFFQSGRGYLDPLDENTPNMPSLDVLQGRILRINDGNDSANQRDAVIETIRTIGYKDYFFNTSCPEDLEEYPGPVVLTVNPGSMTDEAFHQIEEPSPNLMFVRFRANTWNTTILHHCVQWYANNDPKVPVVVTFMAYFTETIPKQYARDYSWRQRTKNSYYVITQEAWDTIMFPYRTNPYVYACGKDANTFSCHRCGNCLREYFATKERCL